MKDPNYSEMTDAEFYVECADVVHHLATQIMVIARQSAMLCRFDDKDEHAPAILEFGMYGMMNSLGDILNNVDAVEPEDSWTTPIFDELHRRYGPRRSAGTNQPPTQEQVPDGELCFVWTDVCRVKMYGAEARLKWKPSWTWIGWCAKPEPTVKGSES